MNLHEAIAQLLIETGHSMTVKEIVERLNENKYYIKRDGSIIKANQIYARISKHPQVFVREGDNILLNREIKLNQTPCKKVYKNPDIKSEYCQEGIKDTIFKDIIEKKLMDLSNYKNAEIVDEFIPKSPGLYCIQLKDIKSLPYPFNEIIKKAGHKILYIGIATDNLRKRLLNQELRAIGHGTFFRSIGAILGYRPPKGSLKQKANKTNYKFSSTDKEKIVDWINKSLLVNWVEYASNELDKYETYVINKYMPLLNIDKSQVVPVELKSLREECRKIANS